MTDKEVIDICVLKSGKVNPNLSRIVNKNKELYGYLHSRYPNDDYVSNLFTLKRIINKVEELPRCQKCGAKIYKVNARWCSQKCQLSDPKFIEERELKYDRVVGHQHYKETCIKKYGVDNTFKLQQIQDKRRKTNLERYGCEEFLSTDIAKKKRLITCLDKYDVDNPSKTDFVKDKISKKVKDKIEEIKLKVSTTWKSHTKEENHEISKKRQNTIKTKYGGMDVIINKAKQTCLERYGVDNPLKSKEIRSSIDWDDVNKKRIMTKQKNKTFNTSKPEDELYDYVKKKFPDAIHHMINDPRYPYECDIYIPSLDIFIEYQGTWTHDTHPYGTNENDKIKVEKWKSKNTRYYNQAIYVWTILDPKKRSIAYQNHLNYVEIWNMKEAKEFIDNLQN